MANGIDAKLVGLPVFSARLRALGRDQKKIVRAGALAAGTVFKKAAQANAPVLKKPDTRKRNPRVPGTLRKSIYAGRSRSRSKPGVEVVVVAARAGGKAAKSGKAAFYWRFVEEGHLARGPGKKIRGGTRRAQLERSRAKASGAKFVPGVEYLKRAFNSKQDAAIRAFNTRIEARIKRANRELNGR